jgi:hypothetical protein
MATHNVDDGTGGIDMSIAFELDRPEVRVLNFATICSGLTRNFAI